MLQHKRTLAGILAATMMFSLTACGGGGATTDPGSDAAQDPIRKDTLAANAYLLAMPGTPCVFYKHWTDCKQDIKNMILVRNIAGIHNESNWSCTENSASRYVVTTTERNLSYALYQPTRMPRLSTRWTAPTQQHRAQRWLTALRLRSPTASTC